MADCILLDLNDRKNLLRNTAAVKNKLGGSLVLDFIFIAFALLLLSKWYIFVQF